MTRPPLPVLVLLVLLPVQLVPANGTASRAYVRKCCKADMASYENECVTINATLRLDHKFEVPKFVNTSWMIGVYETNQFQIIYGKPYCESNDYFTLDEENNIFKISETGELYINDETQLYTPDEYCLEQFIENDFTSSPVCCNRTVLKTTTTAIMTDWSMIILELQSKIIDIGMIISLPFLFSTFLTYAFIKELRSSWHVKFQMCHVATLSMAFLIFIINRHLTPKINQKNTLCMILAYTQQYFFIATFSWLNAMCFNIWWTLWKLKPINRNKQKDVEKFIKYSFYAWGCPLLISITTYFMDEIFPSPNFIRPEFGYNTCWFDKEPAKWMYFYGPMVILMLSDLFMFIHISKILFEKKKIGRDHLKEIESSGSRKYYKQNFILHFKLFIITGGNWLAESIPTANGSNGILWNFLDICNAWQGVFIFVIFVCQKRVLTILG